MPGSSLWLVPPEDSELYKAIDNLVNQRLPSIYTNASPKRFSPHVTLTSDTISDYADPQEWLDSISLPREDALASLVVTIKDVQVGKPFFRKLTMACTKTVELCGLAGHCRVAGVEGVEQEAADKWVDESYSPHCSLMYSDVSESHVAEKLTEVIDAIQDAKQQNADSKTTTGGSIWLVPTFKAIDDWKPVAIRQLPSMRWVWST
ncbi:hypothetical protein LTR56_026479 [Elasticomyces elasticus]|nr:hypothetical protein LTR56_026479 [Elasticomyces elasticus]KAK3642592.1 hypothetical protein LTR22_016030 [Elasticomyces elasticus]